MRTLQHLQHHSNSSLTAISVVPSRLPDTGKHISGNSFFLILTVTYLLLLAFTPQTANGFQPFRIGTGGETGVYYPIGKIIASGITLKAQGKHSPLSGYIGVAQNSAGSIENIKGVESGLIEAGLTQADIASFAYKGENVFAGSTQPSSLRAIAGLYPEMFHIVVRKDAGILSFEDLKGKKISVDEEGSGTLAVMRIILQAYNMSEKDLSPVYLKPIYTHEKIKNGDIQGFITMAGAPMVAVSRLIETGITLLPLDPTVTGKISGNHPYLFPGKIKGGTYPGIPDTATLEVYALLIVDEKMPDDVAYAITETLFDDRTAKLLHEGHPQGEAITLDTALNGISIPLHPGAQRFYQEKGLLK